MRKKGQEVEEKGGGRKRKKQRRIKWEDDMHQQGEREQEEEPPLAMHAAVRLVLSRSIGSGGTPATGTNRFARSCCGLEEEPSRIKTETTNSF